MATIIKRHKRPTVRIFTQLTIIVFLIAFLIINTSLQRTIYKANTCIKEINNIYSKYTRPKADIYKVNKVDQRGSYTVSKYQNNSGYHWLSLRQKPFHYFDNNEKFAYSVVDCPDAKKAYKLNSIADTVRALKFTR